MKTKSILAIVLAAFLIACTETDPNLVSITGKITNPAGEEVSFSGNDTTYSASLSEDGTFEIAFSLDSAAYFDFEHGVEVTAMHLYPGDEIYLTIDPEQFDETITYEGSPTSSFLAKKYLVEEEQDFFGEKYYLSTSEEYQSYLDDYKNSLLEELGSIADSSFVENEMKKADDRITHYAERQDRLSEYGMDVRSYMMELGKLGKEFNFWMALDSLNGEEFNTMLTDYAQKRSELLAKVTDEDYKAKAQESIDKTVSSWSERKTAYDNMPKEGDPAIDFTYPDKDGNEFSLSSFEGSLVYVDVWATWCGPCKVEIPHLKKLEEEYHGKNITFLSVSVDTDKEAWLKMVEEKELGGVQIWADGWSQITKDYAIFGIPRFMLFSTDGHVISSDAPRPSSGEEIRGLIDSHL
jgi:thiol-disulfide isomerase/thioredoxin